MSVSDMSHDTGYPAPGPDRRADLSGWALLERVSPRDHVRLAAVAADGEILNEYASIARTDSAEIPSVPWAMHLTDAIVGRQHFVVFDLDSARGDAVADAAIVVGWLQELRIEHTVCASGPTGGRHVWLSMLDPIPPAQAKALALTAALLLPTLDRSSTTGCVRPPGAPHRYGGRSEILTGPTGTDTLRPAVTAVQIDALHETIHTAAIADRRASIAGDEQLLEGHRPVLVDDAGAPHLPGRRRALSPAIAAALDEIPDDPSRTLRRILVGAAHARWHRADIEGLVATAPGLEHLRSRRDRPGLPRIRRRPLQQQTRLHRKWADAVDWAATHPPQQPQDDPTWAHRSRAVGQLVDDVQARADASSGRWTTRTGPPARRVLDALCLLVATAVTGTVEADVRRLATTTGLGRETVRLRLQDLAADGWISLAAQASGRRAHHWTLIAPPHPPGHIHPQSDSESRSQGVAAPGSSGTPPLSLTLRDAWLATLTRRLADLAHDLWTPAGLGHQAGMIYAALGTEFVTVTDLVEALHASRSEVEVVLRALARHRLVLTDRRGRFKRARKDRRTQTAKLLGVDGQLIDRARRYAAEKQLWAWWCDEVEWMKLPALSPAKRRRRLLATGQLALEDSRPHGPMPRAEGRVDHAAARAQIRVA